MNYDPQTTPSTIFQRLYQAFLAFWQNKNVKHGDPYPLYKTRKWVWRPPRSLLLSAVRNHCLFRLLYYYKLPIESKSHNMVTIQTGFVLNLCGNNCAFAEKIPAGLNMCFHPSGIRQWRIESARLR